jgi:cytochrome c peroxidase
MLLQSCSRTEARAPKDGSKEVPSNTATEQAKHPRAARVRTLVLERLLRLDAALMRLDSTAVLVVRDTNQTNNAALCEQLQRSFVEARAAYKELECFIAYYTPQAAKELNGAPIDEVEEGMVVSATGFQVLEELLFPTVQTSEAQRILANTATMRSVSKRPRQVLNGQIFTDAHVFDALRLELARVLTLGLAGFDCAVRLSAVGDAAISFAAVRDVISVYHAGLPRGLQTSVDAVFRATLTYLQQHTDFTTFDHAIFYTRYAIPLARLVWVVRDSLHISVLPDVQALTPHAASVFDSAAFNPMYFAPVYAREGAPEQSSERISLGKRLFYDPVLSGEGRRACVSCHQPERAFTDGLKTSRALQAGKMLTRNAPTILNAALQGAQFYDLRVNFLEDQAADVMTNADEMHGSLEQAVKRLRVQPEYVRGFQKAFGGTGAESVTHERLRMALSAYERSLVRMDARFDRFMRGDTNALNASEQHGFNLFMGKAKCGTCHFSPLFNGTVPPHYQKMEWEIIGVPREASIPAKAAHASIDADVGRYAVEKVEQHRHAFKTPTLRNVALTAPYMHNGVYQTLEQVMNFYNRGGGAGLGIRLPNQTLSEDNLNLTQQEQRDIIAFMRSLTDTTGIMARQIVVKGQAKMSVLHFTPAVQARAKHQ